MRRFVSAVAAVAALAVLAVFPLTASAVCTGGVTAVYPDQTMCVAGAVTLDSTLAVTGASTWTAAMECDSTLGVDGNFRVGASGASKFDVVAASGNTQIDGTLEVDGATGIDGALRVGAAGASKLTVAAATGAVHAEGDMTIGPVAAPLLDLGIDGAVRAGTAAAPKWTLSTAGAVHQEGALTVGPVAAPLAEIAATGVLRLGTAAAPVVTASAAGVVEIASDLKIGTIGAPTVTITASSGNIVTSGTVEGLTLDAAGASTNYIGALRIVKGTLDCTGGETCDQADSPISIGPALPAGSRLMWCYADVKTAITSDTMPADAAALNIGVAGATDCAFATLAHTTGGVDGSPEFTAATFCDATTQIIGTVTVDDIAAGVVDVYCAFFAHL